MKYTLSLLALLSLMALSRNTIAQKIELINSGEVIKKAIVLNDSGQYKQALIEYNKISRNDTNYVRALYEKALTCEADSQYNQAIKYCQEALTLKDQREYEPDIYNIYGNSLHGKGLVEQAVKVFDIGIAKYPSYSLLYFNKGVTLMESKPREAELLFQKALLINPYMNSAHYQLASVALKQGKIVPGFLGLLGYLMVNPEGKYWSKSIALLASISKGADEIMDLKNKRTTTPSDAYQEVEDIIFSKIALEKGYKSQTSIEDPMARQIQAVFEKLSYNQSDNDFWIQYYLPYFKRVYTDHKFDQFIHEIFSNVNIPVIQDYNKKNKKELQVFVGDMAEYLNTIRATRQLNYAMRDTITNRYYYENGKLVAKGVLLNKGKTLTGPWEFYYSWGNIKSRGDYNATGGREGDWNFYYMSGGLKSKEHYTNGKVTGALASYFDNGNVSTQCNYVNDELDGIMKTYFYSGSQKSITNYKVGKKEGEEKKFHSNGSLRSVANYTAGVLNGTYTQYLKSGQVEETEQFVNGKAEGFYKSYHENGSISVEGQNAKDNGQGIWKYYYDNGKLKEKRNYINDVDQGEHEEYDEKGWLSGKYTTKKGKMIGEANYYYDDGKVFSKYVYDNGILKAVKYFDKAGNVLSSSELKNNIIHVISYNRNGHKKTHFSYDQKGNLVGPDTIFFASGKINQVNQYKNDELNGPSIHYYLNGNKKSEVNMTDGKMDGYYTSFYTNGKPEYEGWKQDGQSQGEWHYYDERGKLSVKYYYLNDDLNGYKEDYLPNGQKSLEQKYHYGWLEKMIQYDYAGQVMATDSFPHASGKYTLLYPGGKVRVQGNYVNGDFDGPYKTYFFDGSPETVMYYNKGLKDSIYLSYYYGGVKSNEGHFKNGNKAGLWKLYEEDGKLYSSTPYVNDMINGEKTYYFPNGNKELVSPYKDDELDGPVRKYSPEGVLSDQVIFEDGSAVAYTYLGKDEKLVPLIPLDIKNGVLKAYYPNGKPSRECVYSDGIKNGQDKIYYLDGTLRSSYTTSYSISEGSSKQYHPNGKLKSDYNYVTDNTDGICREYNEAGVLIKEIAFENGLNHGPEKIYNAAGKLEKTLTYNYGTLIAVKNEK
jgi:uncharacterized protein